MLISKHRIQRNTLVVLQFHFVQVKYVYMYLYFVSIVGAVIGPVLYTVLFVCVGPKFAL